MIIIFGIVIFLAFIMESYVAVKMSERMDALEEANSSLQQQINDFYGDQPISLDTNSICSYFSGYISDIKKKNKGDFTLSFSGNKTKKDEIYLWDKEYIEFEKAYICKNIKKEDTVMVEYTYTNEMRIKKKQEVTAQLKKNWQGYYLVWK